MENNQELNNNENVNKFNKSFVYKIVCKDINIKNLYVGSTTNFQKRYTHHKSCCNDENGKEYNKYLYQFIRTNNGFDNFEMILIEEVNVNNALELRQKEREYFELLRADLNKQYPNRTAKEYSQKYDLEHKENASIRKGQIIQCECGCSITKNVIASHRKTKRHINNMQIINLQP